MIPPPNEEALEVARYVTGMAAQLQRMAIKARLENLAYFLGMVKAEGGLLVSGVSQPQSQGDSEEAAQSGPETPDGNSF